MPTYSDEYLTLIENDCKFESFINALENAARLDYSGKRLSFDDSVLDTAFSILLPDTYADIMGKLKADRAFEKGCSNETL